MENTEETIKNYLKQSFLSLIPRGHRRRPHAARSQHGVAPATSITRLRSGLPQVQPEPHARPRPHARTQQQAAVASVDTNVTRAFATTSKGLRRRRVPSGYARPGYLAPSFQAAGISPPMFRIG